MRQFGNFADRQEYRRQWAVDVITLSEGYAVRAISTDPTPSIVYL